MKNLLVITILCSLVTNAYSQRFEIAVFSDPQFSWITSDEPSISQNGSVLNLNTGMEFNMYFMENYAFTLALALNKTGGKLFYANGIEFPRLGDTLTLAPGTLAKHNLSYFAIPLGLKLRSEELGYTTFFFHGGLIPMLNTSAKSSYDIYHKLDIRDEIAFFNLNYFAEAGIEYRLGGNTALIGGIKWSSGLSNVTLNDMANTNLNSLGLHLGIMF